MQTVVSNMLLKLCLQGRTGSVGLWEEGQEEEWSRKVAERVREKLEKAR